MNTETNCFHMQHMPLPSATLYCLSFDAHIILNAGWHMQAELTPSARAVRALIIEAVVEAEQYVLAQDYCDSWGVPPGQHGISKARHTQLCK